MQDSLICDENLDAIKRMPSESVHLVYLDPPFNSGSVWREARGEFSDRWTAGSMTTVDHDLAGLRDLLSLCRQINDGMRKYIAFIAPRLIELRRVLAPTGNFFLHCDWHASHFLRVLCDLVFGHTHFRNEIIWEYHSIARTGKCWRRNNDTILFYRIGAGSIFNLDYIPFSPATLLEIEKTGCLYKTRRTRFHLTVFDASKCKNEIDHAEANGHPIHYVERVTGNARSSVWSDIPIVGGSTERAHYPTQKPLALLRRIIKAGSNPGDVVLDPFCGSGTTLVAAQQLQRRWIGIDKSRDAIQLASQRVRDSAGLFTEFSAT